MTSNLPDDLKVNWLDNEIVMPLDVNTWSSAINQIKKIIPSYASNGNFYTATFSNNVYSLTPITTDSKQNNTPTAYIDGMTVIFKCPTTNTNSCSVNVNGLGNKQIKNLNGSNIDSGGIIAGNYIELVYDVSQGYFRYTDSELTKHINNTSNPHNVTKAQVGLGNCDNTSDANKPISTATQDALNNKADVNLNNLSTTGQAILDNKANVDLSNTTPAQSFINSVKSWITFIPDYSNAVSFSPSSGQAVGFDGWLECSISNGAYSDASYWAALNNVVFCRTQSGSSNGIPDASASIAMVSSTDIVTFNGGHVTSFKKIPFKGGSV